MRYAGADQAISNCLEANRLANSIDIIISENIYTYFTLIKWYALITIINQATIFYTRWSTNLVTFIANSAYIWYLTDNTIGITAVFAAFSTFKSYMVSWKAYITDIFMTATKTIRNWVAWAV